MTFSQDASISAIFKQRSVSVSINVQDPVSGVFSLGYLAENYDAITLPVALGDQIKVNALPFAGYNFASWEVVKVMKSGIPRSNFKFGSCFKS